MLLCLVEGVGVGSKRLKSVVDVLFRVIGSKDAQVVAAQADKRLDEPHRIARGLEAGGETLIESIDNDVGSALPWA